MRCGFKRPSRLVGAVLAAVLVAFVFLIPLSAVLAKDTAPASSDTAPYQSEIQDIFDELHASGDAYNAGTLREYSLGKACGFAEEYGESLIRYALDFADGDSLLGNVLRTQGSDLSSGALAQGCSALTGRAADGGSGFDLRGTGDELLLSALRAGAGRLRGSGLPFTSRLMLETGIEDRQFVWSVTAIQPLWSDEAGRTHTFTQVAWRHRTKDGDTVNTGLAVRRLSADEKVLYGANVFFDHAARMNHNRMSVGVDARTSLMGVSANRYIPLSGWKSRDLVWEERAASGWDLELDGTLPEYPDWQGYLRGFVWSGNDRDTRDEVHGYEAGLRWSPLSLMMIEAGITDEQDSPMSLNLTLGFQYRFGEQWADRSARANGLLSVADRIYDPVRRENNVRTESRKKQSAILTVLETVGANNAQTDSASYPLSTNGSVDMPATVTVSGAAGSIATLRFADGAILRIGAGTKVRLFPDHLKLIHGVIQYISGSTNRTVNVPGGVITLLGTDIDVRTNGTVSTVRVREGAVRLAGEVSGSASASHGDMATATDGVVGGVSTSGAAYDTHTDDVSEKIDRAGMPLTEQKAAPYPVAAPTVSAAALASGQPVTFGLKFNAPVTVSGGTPRLTFTINGNTRAASMSGGSGTDELQFTYTLQAADVGATSLTVTDFDPMGATIAGGGKDAITTIADAAVSLSSVVADLTAPTISGFSAVSGGSDPANTGDVITITLDADENLAQHGAPSLTLDIGGSSKTANFSSIAGGNATFTYTVQAGDYDADGIEITAIHVAANELEDAAGNDLDTTFTLPHNLSLDVATVMLGRPTCPSGDLSEPSNHVGGNAGCARLFGSDPASIDDVMIYAGDVPGTTTDFFVRRCDIGMTWDGAACTGTRSSLRWKNATTDSATTNIGGGTAWTNDAARNGPNNTALLAADASGVHAAAAACNAPPGGSWYLPGLSELDVIYADLVATDDPDHPLPTVDDATDDDHSGTTGPCAAASI
ncbi:MAG: inverse autotransporter beta domain-containing protein [Rhodospirillales bacterium]